MNTKKVIVFESSVELIDFVLAKWMETGADSIARRGIFCVALSGGKTPVGFYKKLAQTKASLPWEKTHLFISDERFVPFSSAQSNYGMLRRVLLDKINIRKENVHYFPIEKSAEKSAQGYEKKIKEFFRLGNSSLPCFDLFFLGIGEDGHTASLFPGSKALNESGRLAVSLRQRGISQERMTMTLNVINNAEKIIFLVTGKRKAAIIKKVLGNTAPLLPASMVEPKRGDVFLLLDREAGSLSGLTQSKLRE